MEITEKKLSELREFEKNVRKHSEKQVQELIRSIEQFGQTRAIVCDESGQVLIGNGLLRAFAEMGRETAQCYVISGLSDKQKKKLVLTDNQVYNLGADDFDVVRELVADITIDGDLDIPGFDELALEAMSFTADDFEEQLDSYGTITEERLTTYTPPEPQKATQQTERGDGSPELQTLEQGASKAKTDTRESVVCPSCGEVIYID